MYLIFHAVDAVKHTIVILYHTQIYLYRSSQCTSVRSCFPAFGAGYYLIKYLFVGAHDLCFVKEKIYFIGEIVTCFFVNGVAGYSHSTTSWLS